MIKSHHLKKIQHVDFLRDRMDAYTWQTSWFLGVKLQLQEDILSKYDSFLSLVTRSYSDRSKMAKNLPLEFLLPIFSHKVWRYFATHLNLNPIAKHIRAPLTFIRNQKRTIVINATTQSETSRVLQRKTNDVCTSLLRTLYVEPPWAKNAQSSKKLSGGHHRGFHQKLLGGYQTEKVTCQQATNLTTSLKQRTSYPAITKTSYLVRQPGQTITTSNTFNQPWQILRIRRDFGKVHLAQVERQHPTYGRNHISRSTGGPTISIFKRSLLMHKLQLRQVSSGLSSFAISLPPPRVWPQSERKSLGSKILKKFYLRHYHSKPAMVSTFPTTANQKWTALNPRMPVIRDTPPNKKLIATHVKSISQPQPAKGNNDTLAVASIMVRKTGYRATDHTVEFSKEQSPQGLVSNKAIGKSNPLILLHPKRSSAPNMPVNEIEEVQDDQNRFLQKLAKPEGIVEHPSKRPLAEIDQLTSQVIDALERRLRTEQERRGIFL